MQKRYEKTRRALDMLHNDINLCDRGIIFVAGLFIFVARLFIFVAGVYIFVAGVLFLLQGT